MHPRAYLRLKACPRCRGDILVDRAMEDAEVCIQCGYRNFGRSRYPAHLRNLAETKELEHLLPSADYVLVVARNESSVRAMWEAGYQLCNMAVQALALHLRYSIVLLSREQQTGLAQLMGLGRPAAVLCL